MRVVSFAGQRGPIKEEKKRQDRVVPAKITKALAALI